MAQIFQARGPGIVPKGTYNPISALEPLGEAIAGGLQQRRERQQKGQKILMDLYQQEPGLAAATIRGMGVKGLIAMGVHKDQAQQLFEQAQDTVISQETAGGGAQESVLQPGMLRPRTEGEKLGLEEQRANIAKTQAEVGTEQRRPGSVDAIAEAARARAGVSGAQQTEIETDTAIKQEMQPIRKIKEVSNNDLLEGDKLAGELSRDEQRIANAERKAEFGSRIVNSETGEAPPPGVLKGLISKAMNGKDLGKWHILSRGEAMERDAAGAVDMTPEEFKALRNRGAIVEVEMLNRDLEAADREVEKDRVYNEYMKELTAASKAQSDALGSAGTNPLSNPETNALWDDWGRVTGEWLGSYATGDLSGLTFKAKFLKDDIKLAKDDELYRLFMYGDPDPKVIEQELLDFVRSRSDLGDKHALSLLNMRLTYKDKNKDSKAHVGQVLISRIANARSKRKLLDALQIKLQQSAPPGSFVTDADGRLFPVVAGAAAQASGDSQMDALRSSIFDPIDAQLADLEQRLTSRTPPPG